MNGARAGKKCFPEILSRLGGKFIDIPAANAKDAALIITNNGITGEMDITEIVNESKGVFGSIDLRRVDRLIHAHKTAA